MAPTSHEVRGHSIASVRQRPGPGTNARANTVTMVIVILGRSHTCLDVHSLLRLLKFHATVETNLIRKNNIGSFYNYVNRKLGTRPKSAVASSVKKSDGSLTNDDNEKAEIFNTFWWIFHR